MLKVLIVEDDLVMADMMEVMLARTGYEVCGNARTVANAVALSERQRPDLAIIDVRLADDGLGTEIATRLDARDRPGILYATANLPPRMFAAVDGHACIAKPFSISDLLRSLEIVAEIVSSGTASPPFPARFQFRLEAGRQPHAQLRG